MNINNDLTNNPQEHQFTEVVDLIVQPKLHKLSNHKTITNVTTIKRND